jgi:hypothetical protein
VVKGQMVQPDLGLEQHQRALLRVDLGARVEPFALRRDGNVLAGGRADLGHPGQHGPDHKGEHVLGDVSEDSGAGVRSATVGDLGGLRGNGRREEEEEQYWEGFETNQ